jgi:hypothetical protein
MPAVWLRCVVLILAGLTAACGGTSRVADELTATSLSQTRKAVALIKLGAADPLCTILSAGVGVREGSDFRLVKTARIERNDGVAVAELELGSGEYHVVSYSCTRTGGSVLQVRLAVTDWPVAEIDHFKQQRPNLYSQMRTRLMTVHKIEPPTVGQVQAQIQARCVEMRRLQAEGKLQNLPALCTPGAAGPQRQPTGGKRQIGI